MKYIAAADLHIRSNRPQFRKDDYFKSVCKKLRQIVYLCNKHDADLIIAGDFFDSIRVGHKVVNEVLKILEKLKGSILVVAGQHDQVYHSSDLIGSPLYTLIMLGNAILLNREAYFSNGPDNIYGCSFGEEPIKPETENNILVIHKSITPGEPPFFLNDAISADQAVKRYKDYKLIIAGDYHQAFYKHIGNSDLINCGPMMRQSVDQMTISPKVWLIDTVINKIKSIKLKVEPYESVFALENISKVKESKFSKDIEGLIESLKDSENKPDYKSTVELLMNKTKIGVNTRNKVNSILGSVING